MNRAAWAELNKLPRAVWWVAAATLVNRTGAMVYPFLLLYFHRSLNMDLQTAATITACYGVGSLLAGPTGGQLADRHDSIRLLSLALLASGSTLVLFPFFHGNLVLGAATFCLGFLVDLSRPSTMTALARLGGASSRDAFTLNYLAINLGMSVGPLLGGFLAVHDYRWLFYVDGGSSLLAGTLLIASAMRCPAPPPRPAAASDWNLGGPAFAMLACLLTTLWMFMTFFSAMPVYAVDRLHFKESDVGWMWLINTILIVLTTVQINHWTRGRRLSRLLTASVLLIGACYLFLACLPGMSGFVPAIICLTLGEMVLFSNAVAYLQRVVPEHRLGRAMAFNSICGSIATATAAPTVGYFFTRQSPHQLWVCLALLAIPVAWGFSRLPETNQT